MRHDDEDRTLRELFAEKRRAEQRETPSFSRVWGSAERRRGQPGRPRIAPGMAFALGTAALVVATGVLLVSEWGPNGGAPSLTRWEAPTDFLLDTPGIEILRTVPAIEPALPDYALDSETNSFTPDHGRIDS